MIGSLSRHSTARDLLSSLPHELAQTMQLIYSRNPNLNAFTAVASIPDLAKAHKEAPKGLLHGLPIAIKDVFSTTSLPTTAASKMLSTYQSPSNATVVQRIIDEGGLIVGKTNMDEFGMGSANIYSYFGPVKNPSAESTPHSAGGSSGGSAAAVASGMCSIALASDTGGSTRLPAAYCGVVGLKPSYGLISRLGMLAYASSLDCVGIMAKDVSLVRLMLRTLSKYDSGDPTSVNVPARQRAGHLESGWLNDPLPASIAGLRIGIPSEYFLREVSPHVLPPLRQALRKLRDAGATLVPVSLPSTSRALSAYYVIASAEASSNLARYDGIRFGYRSELDLPKGDGDTEVERRALYSDTRSEAFGDEVKARILLGTHALSADAYESYYLQAQRVRKLIQLEFDATFLKPNPLTSYTANATDNLHSPSSAVSSNSKIEIIIHPSAISTAPRLSSLPPSSPAASYVQDIMNVPASLAGLPAVSIPAGMSEGGEGEGLPVGVQVVGQWGDDALVLEVGEFLMQST